MSLRSQGNTAGILFLMALIFFGAVILVAFENACAVVTYAQNSTVEARVTSVSGRATITGNGITKAKLLRGTILTTGDEISTNNVGRVVIDLTDGSQVVILPNSRVVVSDFHNAASLRELLQITLGRIRVRINHFQGRPNPYRVKSPTASIAVRGTEFLVIVEPIGATRVIVLSGMVEVASLRDPSRKLVAEPKKGVIVRPDATIDFFVSEALTRQVGERVNENQREAANRKNDDNNVSGDAANVYERTIESIVESGETALPSRFVAFPDAHLDSLDNPAYADAFTTAEGRVNLLPSINGASNLKDELRDRFGLSSPRPLDYSVVPTGTIFVPVNRFRAVIGGSFGDVRTGLQSLTANDNFLLAAPPFPVGTRGLRSISATTSGNLLNGSLIFARRFGKLEQTSLGLSVERLYSRGNLEQTTTERDPSGLSLTEQIVSRSAVNRTRLTFGLKHDFGGAKLGVFYRYARSAGSDADRSRRLDGVRQPNDFLQIKSNSSEIGFRLRGAFSQRLFYGAEGNLLFADARENLKQAEDNLTERTRTNRLTLGAGLGYVVRPHTIFSLDLAGGMIRSNQRQTEDLSGFLAETERKRARFLSLHAAVQTDVWKNLFVSASLLSLTQSRTTDTSSFDEGILSTTGRTKTLFTDFYSNYGVGWRFKPNFIFEYILTTDYGQNSPRHTFLLRYTFDIQRR